MNWNFLTPQRINKNLKISGFLKISGPKKLNKTSLEETAYLSNH